MQQQHTETANKRGAHQATLEVTGWTNIEQPGFYVSRNSGQGYRIPQELLIPGASPALSLLGAEAERFVRVSADAYIPTSAAKILCADNDISPKF
jgi:hypothetical protein